MSTYAVVKGKAKDETDEQLLEKFRRWFKLVTETEQTQRDREVEDLRFQVGEYQWESRAIQERRGDGNTSGRPILSISLLQQPIQLIKNQAEAADLGVNVHPVSEKANKENAETLQSMYRAIERDSNAEQVRLRALDRAIQCGRGWYRIITAWDEEGDHPFDQKILIQPILHQECVYMDPASVMPDYSDAKWGFFVSWMPLDDFKAEYPKAKPSQELSFNDLTTEAPGWVRAGVDKDVLVAEVWHKKIHKTTVCLLSDGSIVPKEEVGRRKIKAERDTEQVELCWYKVTGFEILDREICDGKLIPLVFVPGRELQGFDGERRWEGMVRPARDGQRLFNFAASSLVERMALEPKVPFIGYEGQFVDPGWKQVNTRNLTHIEVPAKPDGAGGVLPIPQRAQIDASGMNLAMLALQEGKNFVQSSTAVYDPSLGETPKRGQSGRAVIAQQQQSDAGTSNYLQNLANISMRYEARVILDLMPSVYSRPGRVMSVIGAEDDEKPVMLNAPFTMGQDGKPQRVVGRNVEGAKRYDLGDGSKYSISVSVGKSYQTRLQQGQEEFGELLQNLPPELQVLLLPTYMRFRDSPGSKEAADLMGKYRDSKFPGMTDQEGQAPTTEQLQSQLAAMQQQGQMQAQQLQLAVQEIKTDQAKQAAQIEQAKIKAAADIELQRMKDATSIAVATINARAKGVISADEQQHEAVALHQEQAFEADQANRDRAHEVAMAAASGRTMTMKRDQGREQDREDEQNESAAPAKPKAGE